MLSLYIDMQRFYLLKGNLVELYPFYYFPKSVLFFFLNSTFSVFIFTK